MSTRSARILVVDDDDEVRWVVSEALQDFGYFVMQAASGEEALPLLAGDDLIDMVITDVRMPGMSGLELAEQVRRRRAGAKVIVMSGYFHAATMTERFLRKPFHMQELAAAVYAELGANKS